MQSLGDARKRKKLAEEMANAKPVDVARALYSFLEVLHEHEQRIGKMEERLLFLLREMKRRLAKA